MTGNNLMVDTLLLFELKPRYEIGIVLSVRGQYDVSFFPLKAFGNLIEGMRCVLGENNFIHRRRIE